MPVRLVRRRACPDSRKAEEMWRRELGKITVTMMNQEETVSFYTALYHAFLSPTVYMDTDRNYRGLDQNVHTAGDFTNYTTFSLWDTYRALHPLFTILQQERASDMINSMLSHYDQSVHHMLPVWSHHANENWCIAQIINKMSEEPLLSKYPGLDTKYLPSPD